MHRQTLEILTSYPKPKKVVAMGNVAIARGAIEAGVCGVFSYPGTPSTEISEVFSYVNRFQNDIDNQKKYPSQTRNKIYFEYSINEKIALEKAIAYSIGNQSALCVMKNVGMNVASDALMSITYQTIIAPLVIVVCDDPGCHSSSNEQDSRHWGTMASVPVFNPSSPSQAKQMVQQAFRLSEEIKLPVIVRTTTRVSHSREIFSYGRIESGNRLPAFDKLPEHINIPARTASAHVRLLEKLKNKSVLSVLSLNCNLILDNKKAKQGIISSGVAGLYVSEILQENKTKDEVSVLSLGMIHPFPEKEVLEFLKRKFKSILVLEELDPVVENAVRIIAQKNSIGIEILGKGFSGLSSSGEFSIDLISKVLENFLRAPSLKNANIPLENSGKFLENLPPRPPALCAGCPHRATFYLLKLAIPRDQAELIMCGDIGCFGLGALPPLKMIDTINHMGMSISMAQGLYEALKINPSPILPKGKGEVAATSDGKVLPLGEDLPAGQAGLGGAGKIVAMVGDGTFFHSGLSSLVNAVYTRANILLVIFDNRTIGMTGHQSHPGASILPKYQEIDIAQLVKGLGIEVVETIDPFDIRLGFNKLNKAMQHRGVSVIISKSPCIFLPDFSEKIGKKMQVVVDPDLCNNCGNHEDHSLPCSRCYAPKNNLSRAKAKLMAKISIPAEDQLCPANICNHGFFNSILEGDYKSAVEIVRDKMLFARTCGDICHRPCELFSKSGQVVPIKELKRFVSAYDDNFRDFSVPVQRVKNAARKNLSVAIVGAGPAGLSAAYDLVQLGYEVEIFEKEKKAGGMITYAIPDFRMDKKGFDFEAMKLKEMGVKFHFSKQLGRDFTLEKLSHDFDAVLLAIGLNKAKTLDVIDKNIDGEKRTDALSFLKSFNLKENNFREAMDVLVIGGGNSAMDAARSAKRLNPKNKIFVSCIETEDSMPAFREEIQHARNEGINIIPGSSIRSVIKTKKGRYKISLKSVNGKKPLKDLECNYIITSIGQTSEKEIITVLDADENGRIKTSENFTGYENVFAAGDICAGNNMSVIGAIASGKKAAVRVRKLLENYQFEYEGEKALARLNNTLSLPAPKPGIHSGIRDYSKLTVKAFGLDKYNLYQSCYKCNHCIDNFGCPAMVKINGKVQIDMNRCNLCGLCVDVCPNNAISIQQKN